MKRFFLFVLVIVSTGCARIFGWDIHAPGILSTNFTEQVQAVPARVALYLPPETFTFQSKNRGGRFADPQTYHVGEAFGPMILEAFQESFEEFILLEVEPSVPVLKRYAIPYLVVVRVKELNNRVTLKGQALQLVTETAVLDSDLNLLVRFEAKGASDAQKVFAKKGGPEVNLNAAIENNLSAVVYHLQDSIRTGAWKGGGP